MFDLLIISVRWKKSILIKNNLMELFMSFCPICKSEFINGITYCSDCKTSLVSKLEDEENDKLENFKMVEIYKLSDGIEISLVTDLLLDNEIECQVRDMHIAPYPVSVGAASEVRIVVLEDDAKRAREIIKQAREDNYISENGEFIDEKDDKGTSGNQP